MGIFDGRRPRIKVDPPRPRLRINNGTGVDPADIAKRVTEARNRISAGRAIDPLLPPPIPNLTLSFGKSAIEQFEADGMGDVRQEVQQLLEDSRFGHYTFRLGQQDAHLNPQVVSGADLIRNTPRYVADNEVVKRANFPSHLEVRGAGHFFAIGTHTDSKIIKSIDEVSRIENLPELSSVTRQNYGQPQIESFIHILPKDHLSKNQRARAIRLVDTTFHELGHAVSSHAGRAPLDETQLYRRQQLLLDHLSGDTVPDSTLLVGRRAPINTVADYLGETLGTKLRQNAIEEARADTFSSVGRALRGDVKSFLKPIDTLEDRAPWQAAMFAGEIGVPSGYHSRGVLSWAYAKPFAGYINGPNDIPQPAIPTNGLHGLELFHDSALSVLSKHPEWSTLDELGRARVMQRVTTVGEARAQAAYLAHLAAPEGMEEHIAATLIEGVQTNIKAFDRHGINFASMIREEIENAGGLNATMLTAESPDQTIVAKTLGTFMQRGVRLATRLERGKAPIGSVSSIKGIKGVSKAARDGGSYAVTESLKAIGKEAGAKSPIMSAQTLHRMLESAAMSVAVMRMKKV
jgi:hypothetical protein